MEDRVSSLATSLGSALDTPAFRNLGAAEPELFDVTSPGDIAKSPVQLKDWLNLHISLICPCIDELALAGGQHGSTLTVRDACFAAHPADDQVPISGADPPAPAASDIELKVLTHGRHELGSYPQRSETHVPLQGSAWAFIIIRLLRIVIRSQEPWGGTVG